MANLRVSDIKAFVPAKDFARSKAFYRDIGFTMTSDSNGVASFHHGDAGFLLQDFYVEALANNLMLALHVEDVDAWFSGVADVAEKYGVKITSVEERPWGTRDFAVVDPSGVMWRIAQRMG